MLLPQIPLKMGYYTFPYIAKAKAFLGILIVLVNYIFDNGFISNFN
ncbi:hypothetical protein XBFFL1_2030015 [Xenorhabdus bovienii str. feltiae Florida]|nr:hypothetical protein XBFFR1_1340015 [Xenorhabdus bovienii str. feltiae France]CDG92192.1 hypothetical protein XBFFL1_2030015 [Xenorhabdus bovienii str. feltiae Florida]